MNLMRNVKKLFIRHEFKIAKTAKEIIEVYRVGPPSCMKGSKAVGAYEGPDLAVAYMQNKKTKEIVARAVVWPKKRLYFRVYGKERKLYYKLKLENSLHRRGYKNGRLAGARINQKYGVPAIDGCHGYNKRGQYIVIR